MQADASIAALDTSGFMNYGNIPYNDASKDFIMISDKDE